MKRIISLLLALLVMLSGLSAAVFAVSAASVAPSPTGDSGGVTGDCTWKLEGTVLTISGSGRMADYDYWSDDFEAPWASSGVTKVIIENGVTNIGTDAFCGCDALNSVKIPNSVTSIGNASFSYCENLTSVSIPNSVTNIEAETFWGCTSLTSIDIPASVTSIGDGAFCGCESLTSMDIPDSVTDIGIYAFAYCVRMAHLRIGRSVTGIGEFAFFICSSLTSVDIPNSVTKIDGFAFYNCSNLKRVMIPASVTSIGEEALGYYDDFYLLSHYKLDSFTICGYSGTAAESYAYENGFLFEFLDAAPTVLRGDTDGDGKVTILDATVIQRHLAGLATKTYVEKAADADGDDKVTILDATSIQRCLAGLTTNPDIGQPIKPTEPSATDRQDESEFNTAYEEEVLRLVNIERAKNGLSALTMDDDAVKVAHLRVKELVQFFSHTRPDGRSCFTAADDLGVSYSWAGENIAYGFETPEAVMYGWMYSQGHRKNILSASYTKIGIGCYKENGVIYWVQFFIG